MIKKTRIKINTNITVYFKTLLSFFKKNLNENTFLEKLKLYLNSDNLNDSFIFKILLTNMVEPTVPADIIILSNFIG